MPGRSEETIANQHYLRYVVWNKNGEEIEFARDRVDEESLYDLLRFYWTLEDWGRRCGLLDLIQDHLYRRKGTPDPVIEKVAVDILRAPGWGVDPVDYPKTWAMTFLTGKDYFEGSREELYAGVEVELARRGLELAGPRAPEPKPVTQPPTPPLTDAIIDVGLDNALTLGRDGADLNVRRTPDKRSGVQVPSPDEYRTMREALYQRLFGSIREVLHSTDPRPVHIDIYRFAPTPARPYWTLITGGMSDLRQPALEDPPEGIAPRAELIMYVQHPQGWMFSVLKGLAEMPFEDATFLHWGHTVPNGMPMTAEPSELTSFFFVPTRDEPPELAKLTMGGDGVDFLVLVPITESERAYAVEHGSATLVSLMDDSGFRLVVDEGRKSLV